MVSDRVYLGIDFGDRRTGLALSDAGGEIASGYKVIDGSGAKKIAELIAKEVEEIQPVGIVVGYPVAKDGGAGQRCRVVDTFIAALSKHTTLPIERQDERDSTNEARDAVHAHGKRVTAKRRKAGILDTISAAIILQRWLDHNNTLQSGR